MIRLCTAFVAAVLALASPAAASFEDIVDGCYRAQDGHIGAPGDSALIAHCVGAVTYMVTALTITGRICPPQGWSTADGMRLITDRAYWLRAHGNMIRGAIELMIDAYPCGRK